MLILDVQKRLGDFVLRAKFETQSAVTALFGPSGSGKTTIVDIIAGLAAPDQGRLLYRGRLLFGSDGGDHVARGPGAPRPRGCGAVKCVSPPSASRWCSRRLRISEMKVRSARNPALT